jgi:DNA polymerase-3 subunit beta
MSKYDLHYKGQIPLPSGSGVLIPKKGLHEIVKFLPGAGNVQVGIQGNYFVVKSENETFYIRLLEGVFPKYEEIVTRSEGNIIQMDKELFLNMLKRMSILCNDSYRAALFRFEPGILTINETNPDLGESKEDTAIEFNDRIIEAAFNPKYFIDAINGIDDKKVSINILSEDKPCLIHGAEGKVFLSVIMPMRV